MELTGVNIPVLLECLMYSIERVREAPGTPYKVRQENLQRLFDAQEKLRKSTGLDIPVLLECLEHSIQRVREAPGTPYKVRQENLQRLFDVQEKLRQMKNDRPD
jgi:outer membrane biogenesis lipoprotein LolB